MSAEVSLEERLRQGPIPLRDGLRYISQILVALAGAHGRGVIYGNLTPANMMLAADGTVKLGDATMSGTKVDARSDLYAVGAALFEVVTGKPPAPDVRLDPQLPAALKEIMRMSIAPDPASRFQSAVAFRNAIESVTSSLPGPATVISPPPQAAPSYVPPATKAKSHRGLYMLAGAVLAIAILVVAATQVPRWYRTRAGEKTPEAAQPVAPPTDQTQQQPAAAPAAPAATDAAPAPAAQPPAAPAAPAPSRAAKAPKTAAQPPVQAPPPAAAMPAVSPEPAAATPPPPQQNAGNTAALEKSREQMVMMAARATAVMKSMDRMEQAQAKSGLGIRSDMKAARSLMESFLDQAEAALQASDAAGARRNLDKAETQLGKLEEWLGVR